MAGNARRKGLWDRLWIRLPAYLIGAPLILLLVTVVGGCVLFALTGADVAQVFANMPVVSILAAAQLMPLIVPMILVELGNRRRGWAVPPRLCALFVAIFSAALAGTIYGGAMILDRIPSSDTHDNGMPVTVLFLVACCVIADIISWALTAPLIRRWAIRSASAGDMADHF
jgi:hypothetical protein